MTTIEFGEPGTLSGTYFFNETCNKHQITIDCIEWDLCHNSHRFDKKDQVATFLKEQYNFDFDISICK